MESNKIKKVLFFFDSRATFSYSNNIIKIFNKKKTYQTIVSGNFLEKKFDIKENIFNKHKIKVSKKIKFKSPNLKHSSWLVSMGKSIIDYSKALENKTRFSCANWR